MFIIFHMFFLVLKWFDLAVIFCSNAQFYNCAFYLELTRLSEYGFRGRLFIISDSAPSYAREMAGT